MINLWIRNFAKLIVILRYAVNRECGQIQVVVMTENDGLRWLSRVRDCYLYCPSGVFVSSSALLLVVLLGNGTMV